MKKPVIKLRDEIARLQDQLKQAETKEAERIGRLALRAGLGDIEIVDSDLVKSFEELSIRFRKAAGAKAPAPGAPESGTQTN
ncbi:TraC family protein [Devosia sp.]|uniref:TraC family protein n=1 Tax=Devosia sp. TaxID=1871048 RepID=UPI0019EDCE8C|nr:TraC family protein [Devosia sp.]MBE0581929.1 TraC family protein [Devosia sp.]